MSRLERIFILGSILSALTALPAWSCTSILVSRGATTDGSVIITYACDGEFHPTLRFTPSADHAPGEMYQVRHWDGVLKGEILQVPHTYAVFGLMNEFQVSIGETTFGGREELENPDGILHYWTLMKLALQRARTAREAVGAITSLSEQYGYTGPGESVSIADKNEAWLLEIIGTGKGGSGAVWVARRIPDGFVCAHANASVIGEFPTDDPENCLYSKNVVSFAVEKGYYDPGSGKPFRFNEAYCPMTSQSLRYTATRVWSVYGRIAPSLGLSPDYHRGVKGAERYPLWVRPERRLSVRDVMALMRDHYEGTPFDMTRGVSSGPFHSPQRWRPMTWKADDGPADYSWERPISTQQTGFSFVSQARSHLPDAVGGVYWYGLDNTWTSCYVPFYCSCTTVPEPYAVGSLGRFDMDSAWWVFNLVSNYAELRWSSMEKEIRQVQADLEGSFLDTQEAVEIAAKNLYGEDPLLAQRYLGDYSTGRAMEVYERWVALFGSLVTKYNDGYVKDGEGEPQEVGYPADWLETVHRLSAEEHRLPVWDDEALETELPY